MKYMLVLTLAAVFMSAGQAYSATPDPKEDVNESPKHQAKPPQKLEAATADDCPECKKNMTQQALLEANKMWPDGKGPETTIKNTENVK